MAVIKIMTTITSMTDFTFNDPANPKIGDVIVAIDTYETNEFPKDIEPSQYVVFQILRTLFSNESNIRGGFNWISGEIYYKDTPIVLKDQTLQYAVSMGELILDPLTKQLSGVCHNKDALTNAQDSQLFKVFNLPFYASVFKSTNLPADCIDAYEVLKPYVSVLDATLDQTHSRAIDDGTKITFFADKYTREEFLY